MSNINYTSLSDEDKLGLLQLLYKSIKDKSILTDKDKVDKELIIREAQKVYSRIKLN